MARIAGINIPPHKHAEIGLTAIYGIGRTTAQQICTTCGIPFDKKVKDLTARIKNSEARLARSQRQIKTMTGQNDSLKTVLADFQTTIDGLNAMVLPIRVMGAKSTA